MRFYEKSSPGHWRLTESRRLLEDAGYVTVYGVAYCSEDTPFRFDDISPRRDAVEALLERLQQTDPSPIHWEAIIEDYIQELSFI